MITVKKRQVALFMARSSQQWVVRDPDGNFGSFLPWKTPGIIARVSSDRRVGAGIGARPLYIHAEFTLLSERQVRYER
jgi:hypothetical protein